MDISAIRQLTDDQIIDEIEDQKEAIYKLRFQKAAGQLENPNAIRLARHTIARMKTVQREREIAAQKGGK